MDEKEERKNVDGICERLLCMQRATVYSETINLQR